MKYEKFLILLLPLTLLACSGGSSNSSNSSTLVGHSFNLNGIEVVTAIAEDCLSGGSGDLESAPADVPVTITFQNGTYTMDIDGHSALGGWDEVDNNTITLNTTDSGTVEVHYTTTNTIMTMILTNDWVTANCTGE